MAKQEKQGDEAGPALEKLTAGELTQEMDRLLTEMDALYADIKQKTFEHDKRNKRYEECLKQYRNLTGHVWPSESRKEKSSQD